MSSMTQAFSPSFIAVADVHLGSKLYNIPELEQDMREVFSSVCSTAISSKVQYLVIVGDLYDDNNPDPSLIAFVKSEVARLRANNIKVVGVAGDHDKPVNGSTWSQISDIEHVTSVPQFYGFDYFDYSSEVNMLPTRLGSHHNKTQVEWIFLHGHVPSLFPFSEDKKKLDFTSFEVFDIFPNLKGIVCGDIHQEIIKQ